MQLNISKPIVFFDIEATGLHISKDRIVEISILKLSPGKEEPEMKTWRVNPGVPISKEASKINGITDEDIKNEPAFAEVAGNIVDFIGNADLSGFNMLKFDLPMLMEELLRLNIDFDIHKRRLIDVQKIFHMMEKRNLEAAYAFYCNKDLKDAHTAEADTMATYEVFLSQIQRYDALENDIEQIYKLTGKPGARTVDMAGRMVFDSKGNELFNFGKYKGKRVDETLKQDPSYYNWMMKGDFPEHTKKKLTEIRLRMTAMGS